MSADPDTEEDYDAKTLVVGEQMNEDEQHQEPFVPPPQESFNQGGGSSSMNHDQRAWVQTELGDLRTEQSRQGIEHARQGAVLDEMNLMMRQLMFHFLPQPPQ